MYFDELKDIINELEKFTDGVTVKNMYKEKFGGGSDLNMNKSLRKLRAKKLVKFKKKGVRIFYKKLVKN